MHYLSNVSYYFLLKNVHIDNESLVQCGGKSVRLEVTQKFGL